MLERRYACEIREYRGRRINVRAEVRAARNGASASAALTEPWHISAAESPRAAARCAERLKAAAATP